MENYRFALKYGLFIVRQLSIGCDALKIFILKIAGTY
jgi:hypothetical protein